MEISKYTHFSGHTPFIKASKDDRGSIVIAEDTVIKITIDKVPFWYTTDEGVTVRGADWTQIKPGQDYYIHLFINDDGKLEPEILPTKAPDHNTKLIGGFHTLCADVGEIDGHPLSGYKAGDILPNSVWCLNHRSAGLQDGTVYNPTLDEWVMIYMASGKGKDTASRFGAEASCHRSWYEFIDDANKVGGRLLNRISFISAMDGSPNGVTVDGSDNPETTGGHIATNGQRIISNIGCEDGVGCWWQWLEDAGENESSDWGWRDTGKGKVFTLGDGYDARGPAGGYWDSGSYAGVLCWNSDDGSSVSSSTLGTRFRFSCLHFAE